MLELIFAEEKILLCNWWSLNSHSIQLRMKEKIESHARGQAKLHFLNSVLLPIVRYGKSLVQNWPNFLSGEIICDWPSIHRLGWSSILHNGWPINCRIKHLARPSSGSGRFNKITVIGNYAHDLHTRERDELVIFLPSLVSHSEIPFPPHPIFGFK